MKEVENVKKVIEQKDNYNLHKQIANQKKINNNHSQIISTKLNKISNLH